jgi:phosphatidylserine/phosphatidylglycerophosphate/cardiolipin synthase-like enzyme
MLGGLLAMILSVSLISQVRHRPAELLLTDGHPMEAARALERRFALARTRIWLTMFVIRCEADPDQAAPDDPVMALMRALADAKQRGVDVRVCLDLGRDRETGEIEDKHVIAQQWLEKHGIRVVLDEDSLTTHAKVVLIDDRWVVLGSHNWTRSAMVMNREASVVIDDTGMVQRLATELFERIPGWK